MIENQQTTFALGYVGTTLLLCPLVALLGWKLSESVLSST
jgi:fluoride ion exporter CrcB/FEX